ncbi:MAG: type II toxin-antitoxin system VapC family toxin [Candidatus Latescibacteria bacterium]|jgi:predicted nucleic-acid-binding protein|nr:hypothetical protein [Gemmatimonadaceae bacterium]MDP6018268.1 type II toxin-antitoxin system VapC family toxin [Candidatus Latescibacterota bacterium]MDP7447894.1 type II toxin-antitoxin system VapC family toxin [Candidatus Latescibacterota bacterium]HJP34134.1 type II toxin-antitoxin system VapC family toxin [Candidatus Latescibacterota bacterium]
MIGLDTNVLVRYLVQDHPTQASKATQIIEKGEEEASFYITSVVLCELVWVMESAYGYGQDLVVPALEQILRTGQFRFEDKDLLWQALTDYRTGKGDFSDHLIGRIGARAGCLRTLTFDRSLRRSPNFGIL